MLWINERMITEYDGSRHKEYDIHITRGDSGYLQLIPKQNGRNYAIGENDTVSLQVRAKPIKNDVQTELVFTGDVTVTNGIPVWHITVANTTRDCGEYFWDCQLTSGTDVYTYLIGKFYVEEEKTV